jgi:outer membrane protein
VGHSPGVLAPEPPIYALLPADLDSAQVVAERTSPLLRQAAYTAQASAARVGEAKSAYRPNVSVSASFGYAGGAQTAPFVTNNPFANGKPDITVAATATIPIFSGGLVFSQVRQAAERADADRYSSDNARRQVAEAVAEAWSQVVVARSSFEAYQTQTQATAEAYAGARKEEQAGLRTTIEVLNAEQESQAAQLALSNARHDEYLASATLLAAIGTLSVADFASGVALYDPDINLQQRRRAFGWVPWEGAIDAVDRLGTEAAGHR